MSAGVFSGSGSIRANGGDGADTFGGGGGGGRIALYSNTNSYSGTTTASGGNGGNCGGAGTIYIQTGAQSAQLIVDNAGHFGTPTPMTSLISADLVLRNGGCGSFNQGSFFFRSLLVQSNAGVTNQAISPGFAIFLTGDAVVEAGGGIVLNGLSYSGQGQAGYTTYPPYVGGGGGHGGYGSSGIATNQIGAGRMILHCKSRLWPEARAGGIRLRSEVREAVHFRFERRATCK